MSVFGPHYPPELQPTMDNARRFASLLSQCELRQPPRDDAGRAELTGRSQEVEMVVGFIVADWRANWFTERGAVSAVASYLRAMHGEAERHLRLGPVPVCCAGDATVTAPLTTYDPAPTSPSTGAVIDTVTDSAREPER
jgi:hypothetical protein